jgi:hypothetical protein
VARESVRADMNWAREKQGSISFLKKRNKKLLLLLVETFGAMGRN